MESFPMLHGTLKYIGRSELSLTFRSPEGFQSSAVAVQGVCYVDGRKSKVLNCDYESGQKVQFSAVRDPSSEMPEIWKAVVLWTTYKPTECFRVPDWATVVSKLYDCANRMKNILEGNVDKQRKELKIERGIILFLMGKIRTDLQKQITHSLHDPNLIELLGISGDNANYINSLYGTLSKFIVHHAVAFSVTSKGKIFPIKRSHKLGEYLATVLPQKIKEENENLKELDVHVDVCQKVRVPSIEALALNHFWKSLSEVQESGIVFCLASKELEKLLEYSPPLINVYVTETYGSLTQFLEFHQDAFLIGPRRTVFSNIENKYGPYLAKVNETISKNEFDDELFSKFAHQAAAQSVITADGDENKRTFRNTRSQDLDEEIYISDEEESSEKPPEYYPVFKGNKSFADTYPIEKSFEDATTQTFSTGPIEIYSTFRSD